jgi:hypothetical protein
MVLDKSHRCTPPARSVLARPIGSTRRRCRAHAAGACLLLAALPILAGRSFADSAPAAGVDYRKLADITVRRAWKLEPGEHVVFFWDKAYDRGMEGALRSAVVAAGGIVEDIAAPTAVAAGALTAPERAKRDSDWRSIFSRSQAAIWLPSDLGGVNDQPFEHLVEASRVRSIHFHWFLPPDPNDQSAVEAMYAAAIEVPPQELARRLTRLERGLRAATVHVTAANGTDLTFTVPRDAWMHRNTGEASKAKVANARSIRDREEELPASVLRTTDLKDVSGTFVGYASFDARSALLKATLARGRVVRLESLRGGEAIVAEWTRATGAKDIPGEFVIGTNPELKPVLASGFMPYYGYGAGVVRLAIGDNWESGGSNRSSNGEVLMFLPGATLTAADRELIRRGELVDP